MILKPLPITAKKKLKKKKKKESKNINAIRFQTKNNNNCEQQLKNTFINRNKISSKQSPTIISGTNIEFHPRSKGEKIHRISSSLIIFITIFGCRE